MSKFTKTEGTQAIWDALSDSTYDNGKPYTLAIEPEIYTEDGETFIYLNLVMLVSPNETYFMGGGASVEIGRYDNDDDETVARAYKKAMKEAGEFDIYVTEPA